MYVFMCSYGYGEHYLVLYFYNYLRYEIVEV